MPEGRIPVVIAAPPMRTGGTEQHLIYVLPELVRRGFDITAVLLAGGGALEPQLRSSGVKVIVPAHDMRRPVRTLMQARLLRRAVRATHSRILHAFLSEPYLAAYAASMSMPGQRLALVHARRSLSFYAKNHPFIQGIERLALRAASRLIGNSTAVASELIRESGSPERVEVIHNGIPLPDRIAAEDRARARALFGIREDELVLAMVANFYPYKGHADLLEAVSMAAPRISSPLRVLLAGRDAGTRAGLEAGMRTLGLDGAVSFIGEWPGSREPFAAADIGLLVSHTEGFSNSLIEGMASGLPMIATAVGGNLDAIDDGATGLLVPAQSPGALSEAIVRLADDPGLRLRLGAAAREKAERAFSLEACVDAYERLWTDLAR